MKDVVEAIIEIPNGSRNKFEIKDGKIKLDRVLYSSMSYPAEYGFIDNTLAKDGDPLDILVIGSEPSYPGCIIPAKVIGALKMLDNGKEDYKIISVVAVAFNSLYNLTIANFNISAAVPCIGVFKAILSPLALIK